MAINNFPATMTYPSPDPIPLTANPTIASPATKIALDNMPNNNRVNNKEVVKNKVFVWFFCSPDQWKLEDNETDPVSLFNLVNN